MYQISFYRLLKLFLLLQLCLFFVSKPLMATVTYNGTGGVAAQVYTPECSGCHFNGGQFPNHQDYTTAAANIATSITRINLNEVDPLFMPNGGSKLSASLLSLMSSWSSAGTPLNASPTVTTGAASSITKTTASIAGSVNDNGAEASYTVQWEVNDGSSVDPFANSTAASDNNSNSGGGLTNDATSASLTGLSCGTTYQYRVVGTNSQGTTNGSTTTFSTSACNKVPLINAITTQSATEDSVFNFSVTTTDQDGGLSDSLTFTITAGLTSSEINSSNGQITWTPTSESQTSVNVTVQVVDANADTGFTTDTESFLINITLVNDQPVFSVLSNANVTEFDTLVVDAGLNLTDPDDANDNTGKISWSLSGEPAGMTISSVGVINWTPGQATVGNYIVTVAVQDGLENGSVQQTQPLDVTVNYNNEVPLINPITTQSATEDSLFSYAVSITDQDGGLSDTLTYSIVSGIPGNAINPATGQINWTPTSETDTSVNVIVQLVDADGSVGFTSDTEAFTINIDLVDEIPVFSNAPANIVAAPEDIVYSFDFNAADPEATVLTYTVSTSPDVTGVSPNLNINNLTGLLSWTPDGTVSSVDVTVTVSDGNLVNNQIDTFTINVVGANDSPTISPVSDQIINEEQLLTIDVDGADIDGDSLIYTLETAPSGMTINSASGVINWVLSEVSPSTPVIENVIVGVSDNIILTPVTTSFSVTVNPLNDQPIFSGFAPVILTEFDNFSIDAGSQLTDPDDNNDGSGSLSWSLTNAPVGLTISNRGVINWQTGQNDVGSYLITVSVQDGLEDGSVLQSQNLAITVNYNNEVPLINPIATQSATEDVNFSFNVTTTDQDGGLSDNLTFSLLSGLPANAINPTTGQINWTPTSETLTSVAVVIQLVDADAELAFNTTSASFSLQITLVNESPILTALPPQTLTEFESVSVNAASYFSDPDDVNDGSGQINWSLSNAPQGLTISATGLIEWVPAEDTANTYNVTVSVTDGLEDGTSIQSQSLMILVNKLDTDGDTIADYHDNCPAVANTDQANLDEDEFGDACETDTDGDGISDVAEVANGLDPRDPQDAQLDLDGDGLTNLEEFNLCLSMGEAECSAISVDSVAPAISVTDITLVAQGYITKVELSATALDGNDGEVAVTADKKGLFRPGHHIVTWTASDSVGNETIVEQSIDIIPLLSLAGTQVVAEGQMVSVTVELNGNAPSYPVIVDYMVSGDSDNTDHDLISGSLQITSGDKGQINFITLADNVTENDENIIVDITSATTNAALTETLTHTILITEQATAPTVVFAISQGDLTSDTIYQDSGMVEVFADAQDINGDVLVYDWSQSELWSNAISNQALLTFDPADLELGSYKIIINVSDGNFISSLQKTIFVKATTPILSAFVDSDNDGIFDLAEGYNDSDGDGLLDYLDTVDDPTLLHAKIIKDGDNYSRLLQSQQGLALKIGEHALATQLTGAFITSDNIKDQNDEVIVDLGNTFVGGLYDFEIHGISSADKSVKIVIPLLQAIPNEARYRKLIDGSWQDFETTANDRVASAKSVNNNCPLPGSDIYQSGLTAFDDCIELSLSDGGPNDSDGLGNGVIIDPGGISVADKLSTGDAAPEIPSKSPGGGALTPYMIFIMLLGLWFVQWQKKRMTINAKK